MDRGRSAARSDKLIHSCLLSPARFLRQSGPRPAPQLTRPQAPAAQEAPAPVPGQRGRPRSVIAARRAAPGLVLAYALSVRIRALTWLCVRPRPGSPAAPRRRMHRADAGRGPPPRPPALGPERAPAPRPHGAVFPLAPAPGPQTATRSLASQPRRTYKVKQNKLLMETRPEARPRSPHHRPCGVPRAH